MRVAAGRGERETRPQHRTCFDFGADYPGFVAVDVHRPVARNRFELYVVPILIINARVHAQAAVEEPRLLADLVAPDRVRLIGAWPFAPAVVVWCKHRAPIRARGRILSVAAARTETLGYGRVRHQIRVERISQIELRIQTVF